MKIQKYISVLIIFIYLALIYFSPALVNRPKFLILSILRLPLYIANTLSYNLNNIARSSRIIEENKVLRKTVGLLTQQLAQYKDVEVENERLKKLLDFKYRAPFNLVAARVISKDSSNLSDTILIDKGKRHGVERDKVVIAEAGLIGRVSEVSSAMSRVMLITDINCRISAMALRLRQTGMLYGTKAKVCVLRYLPLDAGIKIGDEIMTSGFSRIYPKGVMIGKVVKVGVEPTGLSLIAYVEPSVDMSKTEEVLCIVD